jgi:environmental stress-induced protein Ves
MPWKNGGGETTEIAVFPDGAGLSDFDWRVSMARVDGDGPFSSFPGIEGRSRSSRAQASCSTSKAGPQCGW